VAHLLHIVVLGGHPEDPRRPHPPRQAQGGVGLVKGEGGATEKPRLLARDHRPHLQGGEGLQDRFGGREALEVGFQGPVKPGVPLPAQAGPQGLLPLGEVQEPG
jgi:hypothetical protein